MQHEIRSSKELSALPDGAQVRDVRGGVWVRRIQDIPRMNRPIFSFRRVGTQQMAFDYELINIAGPLTLIQ